MVSAKKWGVQENIRVFKQRRNIEDFLIALEQWAGAIEQLRFEQELTEILGDENGNIHTVTREGLEKSVKTFKLTAQEKSNILENAIPLKNCVEQAQSSKSDLEETQKKSEELSKNKGANSNSGTWVTVTVNNPNSKAAAEFELGLKYYHEADALKSDLAKAAVFDNAVQCFNQAVKQQDHAGEAKFYLGDIFENRRKKTAENFKQAAEHYKLSADLGYVRGTFALGECYERGIGVEKDLKRALELYYIAENSAYRGYNESAVRRLLLSNPSLQEHYDMLHTRTLEERFKTAFAERQKIGVAQARVKLAELQKKITEQLENSKKIFAIQMEALKEKLAEKLIGLQSKVSTEVEMTQQMNQLKNENMDLALQNQKLLNEIKKSQISNDNSELELENQRLKAEIIRLHNERIISLNFQLLQKGAVSLFMSYDLPKELQLNTVDPLLFSPHPIKQSIASDPPSNQTLNTKALGMVASIKSRVTDPD